MSSIGAIAQHYPAAPPRRPNPVATALAGAQAAAKQAEGAAKQAVGQIATDQKAGAGATAIKADEQGLRSADDAAAKAQATAQADKSAARVLNLTV